MTLSVLLVTSEPGLSMPAGAVMVGANDTMPPAPAAAVAAATVELYRMIGRAIINANNKAVGKASRRSVVGA
jgi:hypothetical protein